MIRGSGPLHLEEHGDFDSVARVRSMEVPNWGQKFVEVVIGERKSDDGVVGFVDPVAVVHYWVFQ